MKYLKLLDKLNQDEVVKEEPERSFYQYSLMMTQASESMRSLLLFLKARK